MVRKEPQVQRLKIFAIRERILTKSAGSDVIPVYIGSTIIVLVLQVSQTEFGLALIVQVNDSHSCFWYYVVFFLFSCDSYILLCCFWQSISA